ncbi:MAG: dTMP kinase [Deltaproteobacteria bacterium]|nr:dTMP kinase [Deltaproteobacteria bacterium]
MDRFFTFEGIEGCGKTTQMRMAGDYLKSRGLMVTVTEEPGGSGFGRKIRDILLNKSSEDICAEAELLLFLSARAQHVKDVIKPALLREEIVLCDRFSDATLAYQGFGRGLNIETIHAMNAFATTALKPDKTFLFDLSPEMGLKRALSRISQRDHFLKEDRFEQEQIQFHERVREGYLSLAKMDPDRFIIIDASDGINAIQEQLRSLLLSFVNG